MPRKKLISLDVLEKRNADRLRRAGFRTFDAWQDRDRAVRKGEKAQHFTLSGKALFHESQTRELQEPQYFEVGDDDDRLFSPVGFEDCLIF